MTSLHDIDTPLVHVVTLTGDDYEEAVEAAEAAGSSTHAVAAYLSNWDYGQEADDAAQLWPQDMPTERDLGRLRHQIHHATVAGQAYVLLIDHQLRLYAAYRPALTTEEVTR